MKTIICTIAISFCHVANCQSVEDTVKIPQVTVRAVADSKSQAIEIDSAQIDNPVNANLGELIQQNSSAFVKSYGIGSTATVSFRGAASSHSQLLWNGITLNSSTNGVVDFALFPTELFHNVSVSEGISTLENSSGALGGSVLLNSSITQNEGLKLSHSLGSFGWNRSHLKYFTRFKKWSSSSQLFYTTVKNNFEYIDYGNPIFVNGEAKLPKRELKNAKLDQLGIKQDIYYQLNENNSIGVELWYFDSFRQLPTIFTVTNAQEEQEDRSIRLQLIGKHYFGKSNLKWATALIEDEILYQNFSADLLSFSENQSWRSYISYQVNFNKKTLWNNRLNLDFDRATNDGFDNHQSQNRISYFSELNHQIKPNLKFNLGSRVELISERQFFAMPFARLNLKKKNYELILNGGQNVKYPNLNDLYWIPGGNPDLVAEKSITTDLSLKRQLSFNKVKVKSQITVFYNHIENYILWKPSQFGYWQPTNLDAVYTRGINGTLQTEVGGKWRKKFNLNYAFTQSRSLHQINQYDRSKNKQLIYLPEHQITSSLDLAYRSYYLNCNYQFFSVRYLTSDHSDYLPYYQIVDLTLGYKLQLEKSKFNFALAVQNLFDEEYQAIAWRPMPGRNYLLKLTYELPK